MFKRKSKSDKPPKPPKSAKAKKEKKPRAKREKKPKAAAGPAVAIKKQPTDIYTVMLIISMVCVMIACTLLYLELREYGSYPWWKAS